MSVVTPELIKSLITRNGRLFVSDQIADAIGKCVESEASAVYVEGERLKQQYDEQNSRTLPIHVDYSGVVTIDAYTVYYLPRNTLVSRVGVLCAAYQEEFQRLQPKLNVLDLGSGTGGVILGLLDLFGHQSLSGTTLDITAVDASAESLERQRRLIEHLAYRPTAHRSLQLDFRDSRTGSAIAALGPFDVVFAANVFAELDEQPTDTLLERIVPALSENAVFVDVESQSNWAMRQRAHVVKKAKELGLSVYYPCPPVACPRTDCWMWREDEFDCLPISVSGTAMGTTGIHKAHWLVLGKRQWSIYHILNSERRDLTWGVATPIGSEPVGKGPKYEFCTETGPKGWPITRPNSVQLLGSHWEPPKRGSIVGIVEGETQIACVWDIIGGFVHY